MFGLGSAVVGDPELARARPRRITRDRTYINGFAYHHPERRVTNFDLMRRRAGPTSFPGQSPLTPELRAPDRRRSA
jgi:hypothetical protein